MSGDYGSYMQAQAIPIDPDRTNPEKLLAECLLRDLGVEINPQSLRVFIRWRWARIQKLAHYIHEDK